MKKSEIKVGKEYAVYPGSWGKRGVKKDLERGINYSVRYLKRAVIVEETRIYGRSSSKQIPHFICEIYDNAGFIGNETLASGRIIMPWSDFLPHKKKYDTEQAEAAKKKAELRKKQEEEVAARQLRIQDIKTKLTEFFGEESPDSKPFSSWNLKGEESLVINVPLLLDFIGDYQMIDELLNKVGE
jgi:hypothetical protein